MLLADLQSADAILFRPVGDISAAAAYELGIGAARALPILILSDSQHGKLPVDSPVVQVFSSQRPLMMAIDQVYDSVRIRQASEKGEPADLPTSKQRSEARRFLDTVASHTIFTPAGFTEAVRALLRPSVQSLAIGYSDEAFNFAIWDSRLEQTIGNPLFVEAKLTCERDTVARVIEKLRSLPPGYAKTRVFLTWYDGFSPMQQEPDEPHVVSIHSVTLARELMEKTLPEVLRDAAKQGVDDR